MTSPASRLTSLDPEDPIPPRQKRSQRSRRPLPDVPNVLSSNGFGNVVSIAPVSAMLAAGYSAQGKRVDQWKEGPILPTYAYRKPQSSTIVELRPPSRPPDDDPLLSNEEIGALWALFTAGRDADGTAMAQMSPLIGDVVMAMLMQYLGAPTDELGWVWISAERILEYRNIQKKVKDGYSAGLQANEVDALATCIRQIENFWVKTTEWKDGKSLYSYHSRFLMIKARVTQAELVGDESKSIPSRTVAWQFQPGDWFTAFRDGTRRKFAEMNAQCLQYDPYHELWESRLSKYLTIHLRIDANNGTTLKRRVGAMLDEMSLPINKSDPERTSQRFNLAMDRMGHDGIIAKWHYQDRAFEKNKKARGWLPDWLNQIIVITASSETAEQYSQIAEKAETRRTRSEGFKTAKKRSRKKP